MLSYIKFLNILDIMLCNIFLIKLNLGIKFRTNVNLHTKTFLYLYKHQNCFNFNAAEIYFYLIMAFIKVFNIIGKILPFHLKSQFTRFKNIICKIIKILKFYHFYCDEFVHHSK